MDPLEWREKWVGRGKEGRRCIGTEEGKEREVHPPHQKILDSPPQIIWVILYV